MFVIRHQKLLFGGLASLTPDNRLADIGGGSGCIAESIWKSGGI